MFSKRFLNASNGYSLIHSQKIITMKKTLKAPLLFILGILFTTSSAGQDSRMRLDSFFNSLYQYSEINGNVLVADKGKVVYQKSFGFANFNSQIPNSANTEFPLASVSKVFTSTAVLQLKDRNKFKLDDPLIKYLSDFPYREVTIRYLLSHTSGLPDYELYEEQINKNPDKIFTNKDVIPSLKMWHKPLNFNPGQKWEYSNTNFCLLALLIEKVTGIAFQQYIKQYIFVPAKMNNTYFLKDATSIYDGNKATGYEYPFLFSDKLQNVDSMQKYRWKTYNASGFTGQGNIITTAADLLKFDNAFYNGKLLKQSTVGEAFTPTKLSNGENTNVDIGIGKASYGLGWFIFADTTSGKIVWHTGGQPGTLSIFLRNVTRKQTVIMFDNSFNRSLYGNGVNAMAILGNDAIMIRKKSLTREYGQALVAAGVDAAYCKLQILKADSIHYYLSENDMNDLGLQLLYAATFNNHSELALEVLKLNTLLFPKSFNTYDSYGEVLAKTGKTLEAIFMYKKSIDLNSGNEDGKQVLKRLLEDKKKDPL
jgi:CubicO group peptidase (beta-lactamase class C family)